MSYLNGNSAFNRETRPNLVFNIWYREEDKSVVFENPHSQSYVLITPHKNSDGRHKYHAYRWSQEKIKNEIDDLLFVKYNDTYKIFAKRRICQYCNKRSNHWYFHKPRD